ncbi:tyrosine-type recombinase/integrase [Xanthomonas oryzae pv. oryzicola]|uniref:tyrosine-type recombinase/integrase n=2 Tax=Xanthomonas oryzae TaxID=347 RepID=UPI000464DC73|nr:site-specific integrase [Xanthomonas oryzae]AKO06003.1 integrase [Xanthomonas oryzae pv. oryzicola]OWB24504.1 integrase [Xanthomonas oryzae pv. oryzicola]QBG89668.1 site-specific integrase [Xanthomonas oryzae]
MALTDFKIRGAKPTERPYRLSDGGGLFLEVRPNGSKLWRYAYRLDAKQKLLAIGNLQQVSLADARAAMRAAKAQVKLGQDPVMQRRIAKARTEEGALNTVAQNAEDWFARNSKGWSVSHRDRARRYLDQRILPEIGKWPIREVTAADVLKLLRKTEQAGPHAAIVTRQTLASVFEHAIINLRADTDPTHPVRRAIKKPPVAHAVAHPDAKMGRLLVALDTYSGKRSTAIAIELLALTFVRTKELRTALWANIDWDADVPVLKIDAGEMKKGRKHWVPLAPRALELLRELQAITGDQQYLFPNGKDRGKPMSREAVNMGLKYLGMREISGHDFRATASTRLHEMGYPSAVVEMQLAHAKTDKVGAAYNHAEFLPERIKMMNHWADHLATLRKNPGQQAKP